MTNPPSIAITKNLIVVPIEGIGHSLVSFFIAAGARYEPEEQSGLAHLLEHTVMATQMPHQYYYRYAETGVDFMQFKFQQTSSDTSDALKRLAEDVFRPTFRKKIIEVQKKVVELELQESGDKTAYSNIFGKIYGTDTASARGWSREVKSITTLSSSSLHDFHEKFITPERSIIVVAGDIDSDEVVSAANKLNLIHSRFTPQRPPKSAAQKYIVATFSNRGPLIETHFFVPAPSIYATTEVMHMKILRRCIAGCDFSLLNALLKEKHGVVYTLESEDDYGIDGGYLRFSYVTQPEHTEFCAEKIETLLPELSEHIDQKLLSLAKKRTTLDAIYASTVLEEFPEESAKELLLTGSVQTTMDKIKAIEQTTLSDITKLIDTYFTLPHHAVAH